MRKSHLLLVIVVSIISSLATVGLLHRWNKSKTTSNGILNNNLQIPEISEVNNSNSSQAFGNVSFRTASEKSTRSVVFIKTEGRAPARSSFWFFDMDPFGSIGKVASTGSGVIISPDGYIVTNHHVIKNADKIEVVLNQPKRTFVASIVGKAPSSDLALLKIDAENLPAIGIGNSDALQTGDWVLAVGNPFNLTSTVTAGIVSAKGRNINLVNNQFPIESFIQTDAAINPGNSGGALVDEKGNLVGINTAIASRTGSYVGYGFAIPSNLVVKIVNDLKEFGQIQSGYDGLEVVELDENTAAEANTNLGVIVAKVSGTNASAQSLFREDDIIYKIDDTEIEDVSAYKELLAKHRPGDALNYTLIRDGKETQLTLRLVNKEGSHELLTKSIVSSERLGADLEVVSKLEKEHFNISNGVKATNIRRGELSKLGISDGFIFVAVNKQAIKDVDSLVKSITNAKGRLQIEGIDQNGQKRFLSFYVY